MTWEWLEKVFSIPIFWCGKFNVNMLVYVNGIQYVCWGLVDIMFHIDAAVCQSYIHPNILYFGNMFVHYSWERERAPASHTGIHTKSTWTRTHKEEVTVHLHTQACTPKLVRTILSESQSENAHMTRDFLSVMLMW